MTLTLERRPKHATHWNSRSKAESARLTHDAMQRIWEAFGLQPDHLEITRLSIGVFFIGRACNLTTNFHDRSEHALMWCVDDKGKCQALECSEPVRTLAPQRPERQPPDYVRRRTASLVATEGAS